MTRGLRNCNPLNIRRVAGQRWQGEVLPQRGSKEGAPFCQFESLEWGIRAAYKILDTYRQKYHAVCIEDIISRWAPPSENDTKAYIRSVCALTGFGGRERLTEEDWPKLVQAMARQECGIVLPIETINRGFALYKKTH